MKTNTLQRVAAVDVFRALTMFLMLFVNDIPGLRNVPHWLMHAQADEDMMGFSDTIFPEGLETVPPRFAISKRNDWMLKQADFVVTYIAHGWGGAVQYAEKAQRQGKRVLNLAENCKS